MTAKDKQIEFIKSYLKPKLKELGFKTSGQTWWKNKGEFFLVVNLQNSQWNSKSKLSFCLNIGIALTERIKDLTLKKVIYNDIVTHLREDAYLSTNRKKHKYRQDGWLGYLITDETDINDFTNEFKYDLELDILPKLERLNSINDCLEFYDQFGIYEKGLRLLVENKSNNTK